MEEAAAPSKKAANKAAAKAKKEALKAQRAAERVATGVGAVDLEDDPAQDNYGRTTSPTFSSDAEEVELRSLDESFEGKKVVVRAWLQNSRIQSAKMGFVELRKGGNWTIQGLVMASITGTGAETQMPAEGTPVISRKMVKWITGINPESFIAVEANVKKPLEPVKSCRISTLELHITKCFVIAPAPAMLDMTMAASNQPVVNFSDEAAADAGAEKEKEKETEGAAPAASMLTHLDNMSMHKRSPVQQAIAVCQCPPTILFPASTKHDVGYPCRGEEALPLVPRGSTFQRV
jgi:aspartyl-tRNA synthetase